MSPIINIVSENNFGVLNNLVQVKSQVYTSVVSASLFGITKCLDASKHLESATNVLESVTSDSENRKAALLELDKKIKALALKNVGLLQSASKQLEVVTGDIEGYTRELYENGGQQQHDLEALRFYKNILYKSAASNLLKLSQINRSLELLSTDLELLTHKIADPAFQTEQSLKTLEIAEDILQKTSIHLQHFKTMMLQKLLNCSNEFNKAIIFLEENTVTQEDSKRLKELIETVQKNTSEYLDATYKKSNHLLLSKTKESILKLFAASKFLEKSTRKFEINSAYQNNSNVNFYNASLLALFGCVKDLHAISKHLENVSTALEQKTIYEQNKQFKNQVPVFYNETRNAIVHGIKETQKLTEQLKIPQAAEFVSNKSQKASGFLYSLVNTAALAAVKALLQTSKSLENISGEIELFTKEIFDNNTDFEKQSKLLRSILQRKTEMKRIITTQQLWIILQAAKVSKRVETLTSITEVLAVKISDPDFEKKILKQAYAQMIHNALSFIKILQGTSKSLQKFTTILEEELQKKIVYKKVRSTRHRKRRRDKNSNNADEDSVGRSYKMMNASIELERLLSELEAFVIESDIPKSKPPSKLEKLKQEVIDTVIDTQEASKSVLRIGLLKIALATAFILHKTSKSLEGITGRLEEIDIARYITQIITQHKTAIYTKTLVLSLWNVNLFADTSKLIQHVTADLELFTHEICYPSVRRKEISFCTRGLNKSANGIYKLQRLLKQEMQEIEALTVYSLQNLKILLQNITEQVISVLQSAHKKAFIEIPSFLYPRLMHLSLINVQLLSLALKEIQNVVSDLEIKLIRSQEKCCQVLPRLSPFGYGKNALSTISTWCTNEIVELIQLFELYLEKAKQLEPWNVTVLKEFNRIHVEFAKKLQCRLTSPNFTFDFLLEVNSSVNCYRNVREICDTY